MLQHDAFIGAEARLLPVVALGRAGDERDMGVAELEHEFGDLLGALGVVDADRGQDVIFEIGVYLKDRDRVLLDEFQQPFIIDAAEDK